MLASRSGSQPDGGIPARGDQTATESTGSGDDRSNQAPLPWLSSLESGQRRLRAGQPAHKGACDRGPKRQPVADRGRRTLRGMRISAIETIRLGEFPNLIWVRIQTDQGPAGLGESFFGASVVEAYLHDIAAPQLLGENPLAIERISRKLTGYLGFRSTGAEMRGNSAVDIALWDLKGKALDVPVHNLLGGKVNHRLRACASTHRSRGTSRAGGGR